MRISNLNSFFSGRHRSHSDSLMARRLPSSIPRTGKDATFFRRMIDGKECPNQTTHSPLPEMPRLDLHQGVRPVRWLPARAPGIRRSYLSRRTEPNPRGGHTEYSCREHGPRQTSNQRLLANQMKSKAKRERQDLMFPLHSEPLAESESVRASARRTDPHTSHEAAQQVNQSGAVKSHATRVLQLVSALCLPQTTHELAELSQTDGGLQLSNSQVHKRMRKLCDEGYLSSAITRPCNCRREAVPSCQQPNMIAWSITGKGVLALKKATNRKRP